MQMYLQMRIQYAAERILSVFVGAEPNCPNQSSVELVLMQDLYK